MHARNRSPGNGYRGSSMGLGGVAAASRISSEGSIRGRGMYNSEYRSYNRGFGRGQPKPFQVPQTPSRRGDIFMEAGRLATEYLVSKGMLPPNVLSGKWQNGSLRNQGGDLQGFRQQEADGLHLPTEGRTTAFARLGNVVDAGPDRRRFSDEYNYTGSRNYMRGRRRMGPIRNYGSNWGQEMARSRSWSDRARVSPDTEGEDNALSGYQEEQQVGSGKLLSSEIAPKNEVAGDSESVFENLKLQDGTGTKPSSVIGEELPSGTDLECSKRSDNMECSNEETVEVKDSTGSDQAGNQTALEDMPIQDSVGEGDSMIRNSGGLLSLCRFAKVPTKTRSSLTMRGLKVNAVPVSGEEDNHAIQQQGQDYERGPPMGTEVPLKDISVDRSSIDASSSQIGSSKCIDSTITKESPAISAQEAGEIGPINTEEGKCTQSHSFPDISLMNQQESVEGAPGLGSSSSMIMERGEKRAIQDSDNSRDREGIKKLREWPPSLVTQTDAYLHVSNLKGKQLSSQEGMRSPGKEVILVNQERPLDVSLFQGVGAGPCMDYAGEKQLFPGSFKICDLNLMETSEANESTDPDPLLIFPSIPERQKEATAVGVDLSISNNCDLSGQQGRHGSDGKEVEVIDLENDSARDDKAFNNSVSERKGETVYTGLESFSDHAQNPNGMPDVQDGYGLMFSDLLGTDISNCSSVRADIDSLHNEMALHNGEEILGDDDSIYMSLGEIPISFLPVWEPPTQDYEKPF